ncbi:hypothetical protein Glove_117g518 [Diversispora epigaea]|uniref:Replication origin-binding protein domain-containing protein n=1 Tax=Diversispora epigaea TaxID=1348612 RepID=A0A397JA81_9GLOM|nr:hypothetical protein Glove_117g518 [Diversispora epigaea]
MSAQTKQNIKYGGGDSINYSSDSDTYSNNISECESENCSDYGFDYESDTETSIIKSPISKPPKVKEQMSNSAHSTEQVRPTYSKRQEKFDDKFTQKDLLNRIREIASLLAKDMSNNNGSLEDILLWDYLLHNDRVKEGISLLDAYTRKELADKLIIQVKQGEYKKFSVIDSISEIYRLPGIHECIDGQRSLRAVIDIDTSREDMEAEKVKARDVFLRICCSYIRALYMILDCSWEEIFEELVIVTSSDSSKCSYHIIYAPTLLIDYQELKGFTELVYKLTGEKYGKFIDRGLPSRNFNLRLIGSAKKDRMKHILQYSLDNEWNDFNDTRVQPPTSLKYEIRPHILSIEKINNQKKIIVGHDVLKKYANLVLRTYPDYLGGWDIEERNSEWVVYFNRRAYLECPLCKRTHDKDQRWHGHAYGNGSFIVKCFQQNRDESREIFNDPFIAEKIQQKNNTSLPVSHKIKEVYEEQYVKPLSEEGDVYVGSPWEMGKTYSLEHLTIPDAINLLVLSTRHTYSSAVTTRLNLKSYCDIDTKDINFPDHQRVVCQIESLHRIINKCKCKKKCKCPPIPYDLWLDEVVSVNSQAHTRLAVRSREHLYKLIHDARRIIVMDNELSDLNVEWIKLLRNGKKFSVIHNHHIPENRKGASVICHLKYDLKGIVSALRDNFPELHIKEYHGDSDPVEKAQDFSNVEEASIETNTGTNQMLFRMRCIKEYTCHIEQRASNLSITKEGLFYWLLKAKRECLPKNFRIGEYSQM